MRGLFLNCDPIPPCAHAAPMFHGENAVLSPTVFPVISTKSEKYGTIFAFGTCHK